MGVMLGRERQFPVLVPSVTVGTGGSSTGSAVVAGDVMGSAFGISAAGGHEGGGVIVGVSVLFASLNATANGRLALYSNAPSAVDEGTPYTFDPADTGIWRSRPNITGMLIPSLDNRSPLV